MPRCLLQFFQDAAWVNFRHAELDSLLLACGVAAVSSSRPLLDPTVEASPPDISDRSPFLIIDLPDFEVAKKMCQRSVLIKHIYELWAEGPTFTDMVASAQELCRSGGAAALLGPGRPSWAMRVDPFMRSYSPQEKNRLIAKMGFLELKGPVKLSGPDVQLCVLLDYSGLPPADDPSDPSAGADSPPVRSFLTRLVASGGMREELNKYDLKKRLYIGPTSLDHSLAIIMSNSCLVQRGSLVLDPFVGTASILVAASHFGAKCFGTDIDIRVISGNMFAGKKDGASDRKDRSVWENFRSYGLDTPEIIRMDNHLFDRHYSGALGGFFDAIVTDPPYGIRAGARRSGRDSARRPMGPVPDELRESHVPATQQYAVEEVMLDLLGLAAHALRMGGYISYLIPTTWDTTGENLPRHPCLTMRKLCHQGLSTRHCRHMVVMEKTSELTPERFAEFCQYKSRIQSGEDTGFGLLIGKLRRALAVDAVDDASVVKKASKSAIKRRERKLKRARIKADGSSRASDAVGEPRRSSSGSESDHGDSSDGGRGAEEPGSR